MKNPRTEKCAVVIGRNRRVYGRTFKKENSIFAYAQRYLEREAEKAKEEGFETLGMDFCQLDPTTYRFTIRFQPAV